MLLLTSATDLIELTTDASVEVDVHTSYLDYASSTATPRRTNTKVAVASTVTIVPSPSVEAPRNVKCISIRNTDAVTPVTTTVTHTDGTTAVTLIAVVLEAGEELQYFDERGWQVLTASGSVKVTNI